MSNIFKGMRQGQKDVNIETIIQKDKGKKKNKKGEIQGEIRARRAKRAKSK